MKQVVLSILTFWVMEFQAQKRIMYTENPMDATVKIYVVNHRLEADKIIRTAKSRYERGWLRVENRADADVIVYVTKIRSDADYKIYFLKPNEVE